MKSLTRIPLVSSPPPQQRRCCGSTAANPRRPTPTHLSFALSDSSSCLSASASPEKPVVVVGSANADIYVEIDRLPVEGETIAARSGQTLAGGKGANQACCGGRLDHPTYFVGQVGEDAHGRLIEDALRSGGVLLDRLARVPSAPTGHAVVMLQPDGQNTIIIIGGANMNCWPEDPRDEDLDVVRRAGVVLLQREIPDRVNIQIAQVILIIWIWKRLRLLLYHWRSSYYLPRYILSSLILLDYF